MEAEDFAYYAKRAASQGMNQGNLELLEKLEIAYPNFDLGYQPKFLMKNGDSQPDFYIPDIIERLPAYANDVGKFIKFMIDRCGLKYAYGNISSYLKCFPRLAKGYDLEQFRKNKIEGFNVLCDCLLPHFFELGDNIYNYNKEPSFIS